MGKKRVQSRQVRQVRQVRQRAVPPPAAPVDQRKQQERYVRTGGMLQGYAPEFVVRIGMYAVAGAVVCLVIGLLLLFFLPYGWATRGVAAAVWLLPPALAAAFLVRGYQLALRDRKAETKVVQGQLLGVSEVSTSLGLGMLMIKTRAGNDQFLVAPDKLAKVPGNQVTVILNVTPGLRHVRTVGVMGQRAMPRPAQPVPDVLKRLRLLPIVTPAALAVAAILGDDVVAALPLRPDWAHALLAGLAGLALLGAVFGISHLIQRRLYSQVQAMVPGGLR